ncbi:cytochrome P450 [Nocardioides sp. dk4132]|uniref:cytochrome P450 n=1 Tax=unclassified Nocardioides TaxID=2615069 RepID=UPI0012975640|nr:MULTISPECIES: cytochrome P450 [unclassified Nocardioides]MQW75028.1 cytochrome P450 [Nocardioides sp. dk4132]QGA07799.1 cytochrome P450 [Nocardioides sp. dk884]
MSAVLPEGFDPTDPFVLERGVPHEQLRLLRQEAPVAWIEQSPGAYDGMSAESGTGYWALTRHADVAAVSKNSKDWSNAENGAIVRNTAGMQREQVELQRVIMINQDPPEHTTTRQIVSRAFTPRSIGELEDVMTRRAHDIVAAARTAGGGNFVEQVAAELPLQAIADLIGVPQEDRRKLFEWSNQMLAGDDPEYAGSSEVAAAEILGYAMLLAADRTAHPREDLITKMVNAHKGERGLNDDEFGFFVILLAVAGNETTRNAIAHGMAAFLDHPEQWRLWCEERPATMVDEVIRWATPVTVFQRTARRDLEVRGVPITTGQRVALFYASANYDEDVFDVPYRFDITREVNPHLAFGGHGAHYCLGANLARQEIRLVFEALAEQVPDITRAGPERRLRHAWVNGLKDLPVRYA